MGQALTQFRSSGSDDNGDDQQNLLNNNGNPIKKFKRRRCIKCVVGTENNTCAGCKKTVFQTETLPGERWDWTTCTEKFETNAYGELLFPAAYPKKAKV
jgi:hypothetical protein